MVRIQFSSAFVVESLSDVSSSKTAAWKVEGVDFNDSHTIEKKSFLSTWSGP